MRRSTGDELRLGDSLKALRRREGMLQRDVASRAGVSRRTIGRIERGGAAALTLGTLSSVFEATGGRLRATVWWNGAALDSLLDERHAALVERALQAVQSYGWRTEVEVSFSVYGERGSIDILGGRERTRSAFVGEVKASIGSIEDMNRRLDVKARHASDLTEERFGWRPQWVSRILIVPDESTMRRIVARHELTLSSAYPVRGRDVRGWLRAPVGSIRGLWFLSQGRHRASVLR